MVQMVKSPTSPRYCPTTRIILISPPPVDTFVRRAALQERDPPIALDRGFEVTQAYAEAVRDVAKEEDVAFVDVWTAVWEATGKNEQLLGKFLGDGLHLNKEGYQVSGIRRDSTRLYGVAGHLDCL
jgi:lysophospholipase L1-like esterase